MLPVSVVIPTLNEADNIGWVLERMPEVAQVIIVDGGSTDGTIDVVKSISNRVDIVVDTTPGKGYAMRRGFDVASQPYIIAMDADGSMDPSEISKAYRLLTTGAGMVKGSRALGDSEDLTWFRAAGNYFLASVFNTIYRTQFSDFCYGYIGFDHKTLRAMNLSSTGFEIESEIIARCARLGVAVAEWPSVEYARRNGQSNLRPVRDGFRVLREIFAHRVDNAPVGEVVYAHADVY